MPFDLVGTAARLVVGVGIALLGLGLWLPLLGGGAVSCAGSAAGAARGCTEAAVGRSMSLDPATSALVFLCAGGAVAGGGIVTLVARRVRLI